MATRLPSEAARARAADKALKASIRAAARAEKLAKRESDEAFKQERIRAQAPGHRWRSETEVEKQQRRDRQQRERLRAHQARMADPDQAFVNEHVTPEAQANGDYVKDSVAGPTIVKRGKEVPTSIRVVRNRGGTAIERWLTRGDLDIRQAEAIAVYQRAYRLFYGGEQRVTANWSLVASIRGGTVPIEEHIRGALAAKAMLRHFDETIFFAVPLHYFETWRNVVIFDEPTGTAGGRLGFQSKQAEAAAKAVVIFIADMIASDQRLGGR